MLSLTITKPETHHYTHTSGVHLIKSRSNSKHINHISSPTYIPTYRHARGDQGPVEWRRLAGQQDRCWRPQQLHGAITKSLSQAGKHPTRPPDQYHPSTHALLDHGPMETEGVFPSAQRQSEHQDNRSGLEASHVSRSRPHRIVNLMAFPSSIFHTPFHPSGHSNELTNVQLLGSRYAEHRHRPSRHEELVRLGGLEHGAPASLGYGYCHWLQAR